MLFGGCKVIWKIHSQAGAWERAVKVNERYIISLGRPASPAAPYLGVSCHT